MGATVALGCHGGPPAAAPPPAVTAEASPLAFVPDALPLDPSDAPRISLEGTHVLVDGKLEALILDPAHAMRVDALSLVLRSRRDVWKVTHPSELFPGIVELALPRETPASVVKSLFITAAFAGYPHGRFIVQRQDGLGYLPVDAAVPGPPGTPGTTANGRLAPEVIQRVVRAAFGGFRLCYERSLKSNPTLKGRVSVKFVIERDGRADKAEDAGSEMSDLNVVDCVVKHFGELVFPAPDGGIVTVVYPIIFSPGDQ